MIFKTDNKNDENCFKVIMIMSRRDHKAVTKILAQQWVKKY